MYLTLVNYPDKVLVGQVASEVIGFRPPEPYKGKGVKVFGNGKIGLRSVDGCMGGMDGWMDGWV